MWKFVKEKKWVLRVYGMLGFKDSGHCSRLPHLQELGELVDGGKPKPNIAKFTLHSEHQRARGGIQG